MSGGIDSSVAAMLLQEQGYDIVGITFRTFDSITESCLAREKGCCSMDSIMEAKHLCQTLDIEHHIVDLRDVFGKVVIHNFIDEYLKSRTPNPCVLCNSVIKWGKLVEIADEIGCRYIATGHYARVRHDGDRYILQCGLDGAKDQSYFLWMLTQENLARTLFPLGNLTKTQVRAIAGDHGFVKLSQKKESEEICFVPDNNYRNFLHDNVENLHEKCPEGNFVGVDGAILGKHKGLYNYTIGQRKGLEIALGRPMYVVELRADTNEVVLGERDDLKKEALTVGSFNSIKYEDVADGLEVTCKIRYRSRGYAATLSPHGDEVTVNFADGVESVTPGQSAVFYDGDDVVGGGIIC